MIAQISIENILRDTRVVPVLTIHDIGHAVPLAQALVAGGVKVLEVTLRTKAGAKAAQKIAVEVPGAVVGLGTVLSSDDLQLARDVGCAFSFSPGATPELLDAAARDGHPFVPGIASASELMAAKQRGFNLVKLFPAAQLGGLAALKALAGPFPEATFCPTGGIGPKDFESYLELPNVVAVGGSWLAPSEEVMQGRWMQIQQRARLVSLTS